MYENVGFEVPESQDLQEESVDIFLPQLGLLVKDY